MSDLHEARVEAGMRACVLSPEIPTGQRAHLIHPEGVLTIRERVDLDVVVEKILAAADAVVTVEMIAEALHGDECPDDPDEGESCGCDGNHYMRQGEIVLALLRGGEAR